MWVEYLIYFTQDYAIKIFKCAEDKKTAVRTILLHADQSNKTAIEQRSYNKVYQRKYL